MLKNTLTSNELNEILYYFSNGCALTTDKDIHLDHFISLSNGHAGTYKGNIIPLKSTVNLSKSANNPFVHVVEYLALQNNLSVIDYTSFVYWCYENSRDENEIEKDKRSSLQIWNNDAFYSKDN